MSTIITWDNFPPPIQTGLEVGRVSDLSTTTAIVEFMQFINDVRKDGLSVALFGKPFSEVITDALMSAIIGTARFITGNGDLFFLIPAILIITATFMVGKNKYTKWIIPLLFAYGVSRAFFRMLL